MVKLKYSSYYRGLCKLIRVSFLVHVPVGEVQIVQLAFSKDFHNPISSVQVWEMIPHCNKKQQSHKEGKLMLIILLFIKKAVYEKRYREFKSAKYTVYMFIKITTCTI
jgi:hypothetical protein